VKPQTFVVSHQGLVGTVLELSLRASRSRSARLAERLIIDEVTHLERVFNAYDDESELCRWRRGEVEAGPELAEVLRLALEWQEWSGGAFNIAAGALTDAWAIAAERGSSPTGEELFAVKESIRKPG
jgi:thiamine biosynthesis lipoprotein ApbE